MKLKQSWFFLFKNPTYKRTYVRTYLSIYNDSRKRVAGTLLLLLLLLLLPAFYLLKL